jgi:hypothetical protein
MAQPLTASTGDLAREVEAILLAAERGWAIRMTGDGTMVISSGTADDVVFPDHVITVSPAPVACRQVYPQPGSWHAC